MLECYNARKASIHLQLKDRNLSYGSSSDELTCLQVLARRHIKTRYTRLFKLHLALCWPVLRNDWLCPWLFNAQRSPCCGTTEMQVSASTFSMLHVISSPNTDYGTLCTSLHNCLESLCNMTSVIIYVWHCILWGSMHWLCIACFCILLLCTGTVMRVWLQVVDVTKANYESPLLLTCVSWLSLLHCAAVLCAPLMLSTGDSHG